MIEQLCGTMLDRLAIRMKKPAARMKRVPPRVWIVLLVVLAVAYRESSGFYQRQVGHRDEIADAIGSIGFFYGPPQPDHSGSRVLYLRTSEKGLGLFTREAVSGKTTLLREWEAPGTRSLRGQSLWSLSPDDRFVPVIISSNAAPRVLTICEADSGRELTRIDSQLGWDVTEGAWLTPEKLAWLEQKSGPRTAQAPTGIHLTQRQRDGRWVDTKVPNELKNVFGLTCLSKDTVAWTDGIRIYAMDLTSNKITSLFRERGIQIAELNYSRERRRFLLTCREKGGYSLWRLELKASGSNDFSRLTRDGNIQSAQWLNGAEGYTYVNQHTPVVNAQAASKSVHLRQAAVETLLAAPDGGLFFFGMLGNEPGMGLWRYDVNDQTLTNLVCYSDAPSSWATRVQPIYYRGNAVAGKHPGYYVYRPAHFNWHKKYPLLIGNTVFLKLAYQRDIDGPSWAEAMANCGAYVVIVERQDWVLKNDEEWGRDLMAVYDELKAEPTIDTGKIFLYAASIETVYLRKFLQQKPELWKGLLLFNPVAFPDLSAMKAGKHFPNMLISAGMQENRSEDFKKYQREACGRGVRVEVAEHPNGSHVLTSMPAVRDRIRAMKDFIFEE